MWERINQLSPEEKGRPLGFGRHSNKLNQALWRITLAAACSAIGIQS
jgi:hypothetical protein